jgi:hypothetical protein
MSEPSLPTPPAPGSPPRRPTPSVPTAVPKWVDVLLYVSAGVTYIGFSIYNKWLLDWIVGPAWLVAWVWGLPALYNLVRRRPVRPRRSPFEASSET